MKKERFEKKPSAREKAAVFQNLEKRTLQKKQTGRKKNVDDSVVPADKATLVPNALVLSFPTMKSLQTKVSALMKLIMRCIEMGVGLDMAKIGLETVTSMAYFSPFIIEDQKLIVKMIQ